MLNNKKAKNSRTEEEKKMARELNEAIAAAEKEAEAESDYEQLSPAEQLSSDIAAHLANNAAHRIGKILENTPCTSSATARDSRSPTTASTGRAARRAQSTPASGWPANRQASTG